MPFETAKFLVIYPKLFIWLSSLGPKQSSDCFTFKFFKSLSPNERTRSTPIQMKYQNYRSVHVYLQVLGHKSITLLELYNESITVIYFSRSLRAHLYSLMIFLGY